MSNQPTECKPIQRIALIGAGVIGSAWAARLVLNGIDVRIHDPSDQVERRVEQVIDNALRAYRKMTLAPVARSGDLTYADSVRDAVADADFVQESGPERIEIKTALLREACDASDADVVIASSSSGLLPSKMQEGMRHPERVLVGHPFNPVYLIPLVEIVGGARTSDAARETAGAFYRGIGMHPLQVRKEIDAFLADRMMEALWREALHLVNEGVATVDEIDQAICYGPGLRWSFMGTFMVYRIAGGEGGFRHFMAQFGPSLKWPWTRFDGPDLTDELLERLTAQSDAQADGASIAELEHLRDDCLVSVMQALRHNDYAAGAVLKRYEERLYERHHAKRVERADGDAAPDLSQPLTLHRAQVPPDWIDYNDHMSESRYLQAFGDASDALFRFIGVDRAYHQRGFSYYTVETHINFLREIGVGEPFHITTQLLAADAKRIHLFHCMHASDTDDQLATTEQMLLHVDSNAGKVCAAEADVVAKLEAIMAGHRGLAKPEFAGRCVGRK